MDLLGEPPVVIKSQDQRVISDEQSVMLLPANIVVITLSCEVHELTFLLVQLLQIRLSGLFQLRINL
jgi:hypothetical protein